MKNSFIRFILVGIVNTIVGLSSMYLFLHAANLSYWASTFLGNAIGACVSYILNRNFTFKSDHSVMKSAFRFIIVILSCYFISYDLGKNIVSWVLKSNEFFSDSLKTDIAILVGTGMYTILNYLGQKIFVFPNKTVKVHPE
jgi:putative flippase GtrA